MKRILIAFVVSVVLGIGLVYAQDTFDEVTLNDNNPIVDSVLDFDNMEIHLVHSEVRSYRVFRDADGNEVRRIHGPNFIYINEPEDNPDTPYDDTIMHNIFMQKLGINKAKIKQAVKEMELLKNQ